MRSSCGCSFWWSRLRVLRIPQFRSRFVDLIYVSLISVDSCDAHHPRPTTKLKANSAQYLATMNPFWTRDKWLQVQATMQLQYCVIRVLAKQLINDTCSCGMDLCLQQVCEAGRYIHGGIDRPLFQYCLYFFLSLDYAGIQITRSSLARVPRRAQAIAANSS